MQPLIEDIRVAGSRNWIAAPKRLARRLMGDRLYIHTVPVVRRRWVHAVLIARRLRSGGASPSAMPQDIPPPLREKWLSGDAVPDLAFDSPLRAYLERSGRSSDPAP